MTETERINKFATLADDLFGILDGAMLTHKLKDMGYFKAPASVNHHGNYDGGLFDHSWAVMEALENLTYRLDLKWERKESLYIVGLLHDLCKCNSYVYNEETGQWEYNNNITINGHGELSVILAQQLIQLTEEEMLCIRWHMGAYDDEKNWNILGRAIEEYPNVLYTHTADMIASRIQGI
jgi:hypothetical protein